MDRHHDWRTHRLERVSWKKNCQRLIDMGYIYANAHGDFTLTEAGEKVREEYAAAKGID
jgi:Mn-dependent DtxR family transcriptional regulator